MPVNYFAIFLAPPDENELLQNREWLELVLTHEFTHIVHLDKAYGPPYSLRRLFGRLALLFPNALEPTWITEGLAVYVESDPSSRLRPPRPKPVRGHDARRGRPRPPVASAK